MTTTTPTPLPDPATALPADHPLHEVMALVNEARIAALGDIPLPPTPIDLATAIAMLAHAVTLLACRTLDPAPQAGATGEEGR